jgi:hypothetical protein
MTPLQTLGQSLSHWQAIYIVSIAAALLSTFAIVVFAFHIQRPKFGLKVSNYIYVVASLLAVVSTIVIVDKTRSLDSEKDRVTSLQIAEANGLADSARVLATQTANDNLKLEQELQEHEAHERSYEQRQQAATKATHRTIPDPKEFSLALEKLPKDVRVTLVQNLADDEAGRLLRQLYDIFVAAGFSPSRGGFMGTTSSDPVSIPGIHLHCTLDPSADMMCNSLVKQFKAAGIKPDREIGGSLRNEQFPTGLPGPSAAVWIYVGPAQ